MAEKAWTHEERLEAIYDIAIKIQDGLREVPGYKVHQRDIEAIRYLASMSAGFLNKNREAIGIARNLPQE